ncbi:MAG: tripartite tricarboxylate transporter substrate binding protein [Pseudomonadota bacterium]
MNLKRLAGALAAASLLLSPALAQEWPARPVRLIVPFGPGSTPDTVARILSEKLTQRLGKPFVVENKPGAGGNVGTDAIAKAAPDGYTFGLTISGPLAANTLLFKKLPYDPQRDLDPISIVATQPSVLVVSAQSGFSDMPGLLAGLRSNAGKFNYSSMGMGSISHLAMEALAARSGTEVVHVPYASSGLAVAALLAGDTQIAVLPAVAVMPHVRSGKLKAIAVATGKRSTLFPDLPTLSEAGLQDVQGDAWMGIVVPAKTPAAISKKLHEEIVQIVRTDEIRQKLHGQLMEPVGGTPAEFRATLNADLMRWQPIIKKNNITLD